jgi:hypothetical protein
MLLVKLIVSHLVKSFVVFMNPDGPLRRSLQPVIYLYPKPYEYCPHPHTPLLMVHFNVIIQFKGKAIPLYAMEALGGRGGIAPTHSRPRH